MGNAFQLYIHKTNKLIEIINYIDIICNPDTRFSLTEKGEKYLEELEEENKSFER